MLYQCNDLISLQNNNNNISGNNNNNSNNNMPQMNQQRISAPAPSKSSLKPFIPRPDDVKYKVRSDFL